MKKIFAYAAPLAMAMSINVAVPTAANAEAGGVSGTAHACQLITDVSVMNQGTCMNLLTGNNPVGLCKLFDALGILQLIGYKNVGQCVKLSPF